MSMYFNDKQLAELRKEFRTHPVDEEGRVQPVEYSEEYVRGTVLKLLAEIERLTKERDDHGPEGRNYTNGQYVELLMKYEALQKMLNDVRREIGYWHSSDAAIACIKVIVGEGEKP
ncbi:hypothetical protein [Paenibacillus oleatilyticus]|uniref:hypothetical protein n=1 Tax=Paenibacillus oleatilyticus TaxID=2594886 RepID=UPI001C1FAA6E|nr:hypothetical protein [Paenibacillus oleatilyticus]MBU7320296.1 hypothetical protein [Paenibacillus oleatilyticus]